MTSATKSGDATLLGTDHAACPLTFRACIAARQTIFHTTRCLLLVGLLSRPKLNKQHAPISHQHMLGTQLSLDLLPHRISNRTKPKVVGIPKTHRTTCCSTGVHPQQALHTGSCSTGNQRQVPSTFLIEVRHLQFHHLCKTCFTGGSNPSSPSSSLSSRLMCIRVEQTAVIRPTFKAGTGQMC
jgi:hypothetical protein